MQCAVHYKLILFVVIKIKCSEKKDKMNPHLQIYILRFDNFNRSDPSILWKPSKFMQWKLSLDSWLASMWSYLTIVFYNSTLYNKYWTKTFYINASFCFWFLEGFWQDKKNIDQCIDPHVSFNKITQIGFTIN